MSEYWAVGLFGCRNSGNSGNEYSAVGILGRNIGCTPISIYIMFIIMHDYLMGIYSVIINGP